MSSKSDVVVPSGYAASSETTIYTSTSMRTIIDKFGVYNSDTAPVNYIIKLVPPSQSAGASHVLMNVTVPAGEAYMCPEVVGQTVEVGGFISEVASTASKLVRRVSGRKVVG